jgi:hypothetical protein
VAPFEVKNRLDARIQPIRSNVLGVLMGILV